MNIPKEENVEIYLYVEKKINIALQMPVCSI